MGLDTAAFSAISMAIRIRRRKLPESRKRILVESAPNTLLIILMV